MNNGGDNISNSNMSNHRVSEITPVIAESSDASLETPSNIQISTKNLMINSLNSAGSDMEDSVTEDSTSDLRTERYITINFTLFLIEICEIRFISKKIINFNITVILV